MRMRDMFGQATARWVRYEDYACVKDKHGEWHVVPTTKATSVI